jgi:hypothetical protein
MRISLGSELETGSLRDGYRIQKLFSYLDRIPTFFRPFRDKKRFFSILGIFLNLELKTPTNELLKADILFPLIPLVDLIFWFKPDTQNSSNKLVTKTI